MNEGYSDKTAMQATAGGINAIREDVTVRQNIEAKIARHQAAIAELEKTKTELGPLMDMRIDRLRSAMNGSVY